MAQLLASRRKDIPGAPAAQAPAVFSQKGVKPRNGCGKISTQLMASKPRAQRTSTQLCRVARRCIWWQQPAKTLANPGRFLAYAMTYGSWEDWQILRRRYGNAQIREALRQAPPGVFDPASWHYWHHMVGCWRVPPLPARKLPGLRRMAPSSKFTWHLPRRDAGASL